MGRLKNKKQIKIRTARAPRDRLMVVLFGRVPHTHTQPSLTVPLVRRAAVVVVCHWCHRLLVRAPTPSKERDGCDAELWIGFLIIIIMSSVSWKQNYSSQSVMSAVTTSNTAVHIHLYVCDRSATQSCIFLNPSTPLLPHLTPPPSKAEKICCS